MCVFVHTCIRSHHASIEVLVNSAKGVWCRLSLAGQQQANVGDAQCVDALPVGRSTVRH